MRLQRRNLFRIETEASAKAVVDALESLRNNTARLQGQLSNASGKVLDKTLKGIVRFRQSFGSVYQANQHMRSAEAAM